jgi:hypothetical protein
VQHVVLASGGQPQLLEQRGGAPRQANERRHRGPQVGGQPAQLGARHQPPGLIEERQRHVDRLARLPDAGAEVAGQAPQRGQAVVQLPERRLRRPQRDRQLRDRGLEASRLARERARGRVEVGDQALQPLRPPVEPPRHAAGGIQVLREVVLAQAARGLLHYRRAAIGVLPVGDRAPVAVGALGLDRTRVLAQERLQVLARVGLERGEHLPQLDRRARLLDREHAAALDLAGVGGARLELEEPVALEEQPWADLQARVAVDRQALVVDLHPDQRPLAAGAGVLDRNHLAHVHARDPHGLALLDVHRAVEDRAQLVRRPERQLLGEGEVGGDGDHHQRQHARPDLWHPRVGPHGSSIAPVSGRSTKV